MSAPNGPCPCGSGRKYKKCCRVFHYGRLPDHPEQLMRSRYAAYAVGAVDYILSTTHPTSPHFRSDTETWRAEVRRFCQQVTFLSLRVEHAEAAGDSGLVRFFATLKQGERDASFGEESAFVRRDGQWLYVAGKPHPS
ncbi:MAG: YchJ family metal-binding protein [Myxococcota bacterium]|nr:YchJ family metal-binding protein [Myxococcota bacterium]